LDALSYIKYVFVGVSLNEYQGLHLHCLKSQLKAGKCPITSGHQIILQYGLEQYSTVTCVGGLIGLILGFRLIAYIALKLVKI
jgi:ATP-binding cassette subfamily G (WHITE) protein 2